ncbi:hypothetical protein RHSIM_Rhsim06G0050200 [Rhododendron simsii]|uniref:Cold regulated protein 27 n=1 Tax=Rhododendron simsii TaxID=118357 RepID=A0A834LLV6_RHOSS|nr:hypothetical protein RHSIM_Rhsim06G0050200 [Rhododendron simsii]
MEPPRVPQAVGGGASANSVEIPHPLCQDSPARDSIPTEWTDEKHSLYLKSMEASFVNELYSSFDLLGWRSQREHSSDPKLSGKKHASSCTSSGQFKVLQSGCWGNINFARHESQLEKAEGTGVILANPWIRHFRSSQRKQLVISSTLQGKSTFGSLAVRVSGKMALTSDALASNLEQLPASHSNLRHYDDTVDSSNTEMTGQNFVDEDTEVEKARSHMGNVKRMRTSVVSTPSNDQVVPFGKFPANADVSSRKLK